MDNSNPQKIVKDDDGPAAKDPPSAGSTFHQQSDSGDLLIGASSTSDDPTARTTDNDAPRMSKNQLRKIKRWEKKMEIKKRRKQQDKEGKAAKAKAQGRDIEEERRKNIEMFGKGQTREKRIKQWQNRTLPYMRASFQVCLDCSFEANMTPKETNSLAQQIRYCYASNRRSNHPCTMTVTSAGGETLKVLQNVSGFEGWKTWEFHYATASLEAHFQDKLDKVIYLTSDSDNVLTTLENDKIYVIGGIVDRNRLKRAAIDRANALNVKTARLPIDAYLKEMPSTRVLTCNHVYDLLLKYREYGGDWKKSLMEVLPSRKEAQFVGEEPSTDSMEGKEAEGENKSATDDTL